MSHHIPRDLLLAFVDGDVDDTQAERIAIHLDSCPRCMATVEALDPLADAFAASAAPRVPDDLIARILQADLEASTPSRMPYLIGALMVAASFALMLAGSDPADLLFDGLRATTSVLDLGAVALQASLTLGALALATTLFLTGSGLALRLSRRTL